jgi:hypothetical protein
VTILDTNVISEVMRMAPSPRVARWLASFPPSALFTTSVNKTEILYGVELMPQGRKRASLQRAATAMFQDRFLDRVLAYGQEAAPVFAVLAANRRRLGRPIGQFDCQIAAIARVHGASIATRDLQDFVDCGVELIDPWA